MRFDTHESGDEGFLSTCENAGWGINNCWHTEDAKAYVRFAVILQKPLPIVPLFLCFTVTTAIVAL